MLISLESVAGDWLSEHREISVDTQTSIYRLIELLSYGGHGCLSFYWEICIRQTVNAKIFVDSFPVGSRAFRTKHHLWDSEKNYKDRRWRWIRQILLKLEAYDFISIEPLHNSSRLGLQSTRKFTNADYVLRPKISKIILRFRKQGKYKVLKDLVSIHRFVMSFIPRHVPPKYISERVLKSNVRKKVEKTKGKVTICFPIEKAVVAPKTREFVYKEESSMPKEDLRNQINVSAFEQTAKLFAKNGENMKAARAFKQAAVLWEKIGDDNRNKFCMANHYSNLGKFFFAKHSAHAENFAPAGSSFRKAAAYFMIIGDKDTAKWHLARAFECDYYIAKNERDLMAARDALGNVVKHYEIGGFSGIAYLVSKGDLIKYNGLILKTQKRYSDAFEAFLEAEKLYKRAADYDVKYAARFSLDAEYASALAASSDARARFSATPITIS
jgi:tetratricopeptide (TPR) repeat protein